MTVPKIKDRQYVICFRLDSGYRVGSGHLMRCRNLALQMRKHYQNPQIIFLSQEYSGNLINLLEKDRFTCLRLPLNSNHQQPTLTSETHTWLGGTPEDDVQKCLTQLKTLPNFNQDISITTQNNRSIDLMIIDHYAIDHRWVEYFDQQCNNNNKKNNNKNNNNNDNNKNNNSIKIEKVLVIDDMHDRIHRCDFLLDQTYYHDNQNPYQLKNLVRARHPKQPPKFLMGSKYLMLSPLFGLAHDQVNLDMKFDPLAITRSEYRIQINFGGTDLSNETEHVVKVLIDIIKNPNPRNNNHLLLQLISENKIHFDIIVGRLYQNLESLQSQMINLSTHIQSLFTIHYDIDYETMINLLQQTHLFIGATGVSIYERCCLGVPSIAMSTVDNQRHNAINLSKLGAIDYIGHLDEWTDEQLIDTLMDLLNPSRSEKIKSIAEKGYKLVDGHGCQNIIDSLNLNYT